MRRVQSNYQEIVTRGKEAEYSNQLIKIVAGFFGSRMSLILLLIPFVIIFPGLNSFPYPASGSPYSDITISHYPNLVFLRDSLLTTGEIPFWSNTILSGYPFVANPLAGLMYPFGWLALIIPSPLGFNLLIALHLVWGGLGLYLLLKQEGISHISALLAGIIFVMLPKFYAHYGAGHLTLLYAVPWTAWLLWSQARIQNQKDRSFFPVPPGIILALIVFADVRWAGFSAFLWWIYAFIHRRIEWRKLIVELLAQSTMGLLLAAPMLVPLAEYVLLSTRSSLELGDIFSFSLPISGLLGLLFPNSTAFHEWVLYPGMVAVVFTIFVVLRGGMNRNIRFWLGGLLFSLIIALGSQIPGIEYLAQLPLVSLLRVPSRSLFITGLCFSALAGYGFERITHQGKLLLSIKRHQLAIFGVLVFTIAMAAGLVAINAEFATHAIWGVIFLITAVAWINLSFTMKIPDVAWITGLVVIVAADLGIVSFNSYQSWSADKVFKEGDSAATYLSGLAGEFRVYSPSYSIPQHTAIGHGLELADGIDPLQSSAYAGFMELATGVPQDGYSVTIPPFKGGDPNRDNARYSPDALKLGLLNVRYVVADYPMNVAGLNLEANFDQTRIYNNAFGLPRAWVEQQDENQAGFFKPALILDSRPNRILLSALGPGSLVLSEIDYPGWEVYVDGEEKTIQSFQGLLRKVDLAPGDHVVEFIFRPLSLAVGIVLFFAGFVLMVWYLAPQRKVYKREISKPI